MSVLGSKHKDIVRGLVPVGNNQVDTIYSKEKSDDSDENTLITDQGHMDYLEGNYARNRAARGAQVGGALGGGALGGGALGGGARPKVATVEGAMIGQ